MTRLFNTRPVRQGRIQGPKKRRRFAQSRLVPRLEKLEDRFVLSSFISSALHYGADTTFEDQSREAFVDVDGGGTFSVGDVMLGFIRFDNQSPDGLTIANRIYTIF